ncbi:MAG: hypothetical protein ACQES4_02455 [Bacillota bacterium]
MEMKRKGMKNSAQKNVTVKVAAKYPCATNGTRRPCPLHCTKCFYEVIYCQN